MRYPAFLKKGDIIGVTAPSDGNKHQADFNRLDNGIRQLKAKGYSVLETAHVRTSEKGRSTDARQRAEEFKELLLKDNVKWIISAKGGDYLVEMLSFVDFNEVKAHPKWFQGFSDNTGLTFTITTHCNIATVYGNNFNDFGMEEWHTSLKNNLAILEGVAVTQRSFERYESGYYERETGLENYILTEPVNWRNITSSEVTASGRLLGGCLDVLLNLVGTRFDNTVSFMNQYKEDGILWYLESFSLSSDALTRGLWQLKEAGWFQTAKGFLFGRPAFFDENSEISYEEAVLSVLSDLQVPIILDADTGHKAPQFTMVNGAVATVHSKDGKGSLTLEFI